MRRYATAGIWAVSGPALVAVIAARATGGSLDLNGNDNAARRSIQAWWGWVASAVYVATLSVWRAHNGFIASLSLEIIHICSYPCHLQMVPHKEERFLAPLVPILNGYASLATATWAFRFRDLLQSRRLLNSVFFFATVASLGAGCYLTRVHQAAPEPALDWLRQELTALVQQPGEFRSTRVHVLAPCYTTPGLSFLHTGLFGEGGSPSVEAFGLECSPRFQEEGPVIPIVGECAASLGLGGVTERVAALRQHWNLGTGEKNVELGHGCPKAWGSASSIFEAFPFSVATALYGNSSIVANDGSMVWAFPDWLVLWDGMGASDEARLFDDWVQRHFSLASSFSHGHVPTFGTRALQVWKKRL